jgi:hypothetical protein
MPLRIWTVLILLVATGCGHRPAAPVHPPLKKIYVLPVNPPSEVATENRNLLLEFGWLTSLAQRADNQAKAKQFGYRMREERQVLGEKMTLALLTELPRHGYEVELIERIPGTPDDPEDIDFAKARVDGPILHVWFFDVGFYSPRSRIDYEPKINVAVRLAYPLDEHLPYDEWLYYGTDSRGEKYWSIPAVATPHRFTSFDSIVDHPEDVVAVFDAGIAAIARHIAKEFRRLIN